MRVLTIILAALAGLAPATAAPLSYNRDVRPILSENCFACHGPDPGTREAKLRLDVREAALDKEAFVPGDPEASELVYRITTDDEDDLMPPPDSHKALTAAQKDILARWIEQGAQYEAHWAYIPPKRPPVPDMGAAHPIDNFILAGQKPEGLALSPPAAPSTLARRLSLDLTGLPPEPSIRLRRIKDPASGIDSLLSSPHFGERMAVFWLDLARYADTIGYHSDEERDVTPYRDYVIRAFNGNKPYDEFIIEQLAGDLLENPTLENYVATTFNRVNQISEEGGIQDAEYIAKYYAERVRTTSVAFLGATMGCAECHDHKFDPFTAEDFYAMEAFFSDIFEKGAYNGDGRFNEGADIKAYPVAAMSQWGPRLDLPTPEQSAELNEILAGKTRVQAEIDATTPELELAFIEWLAEQAAALGDKSPRDVAVLDDEELNIGDIETVAEGVFSGAIARRQKGDEMVHHVVKTGKRQMHVVEDDVFFTYVWLDPEDPPKQLMLQFRGKNWNHRAWWGEDRLEFGQGSGDGAHRRVGGLPDTGTWVRLEVPASDVGFEPGDKVTQLGFTQFGGTVHWDLVGRHTTDLTAEIPGLSDKAREALIATEGRPPNDEQRKVLLAYYRDIAPLLAPQRERRKELQQAEDGVRAMIRSTLITLPAKPREVRILPRGNWMDTSGPVVQPAVPEFLTSDLRPPTSEQRLTRLDLAHWITARDNPLTARAFVNRIWAQLFGTGLSRDLQDLGNQGRWPTHPELLDWLAVEFMETGWDVKHLVKLIVTSKTYQQSSNPSQELQERDPYNELYARQNARRLPAEFVRDNALAVSGLLNRQIGGRNARPYQPAGYYRELNFPKREYEPHQDDNQYRRGLYMHWQRSFLHPMLIAFDAPAREECTASRERSNTPLQALNLLNDPTFVEAARVFAANLMEEHEPFADRLAAGFQHTLARAPSGEESSLLATLYNKQLGRYRDAPDDAMALLEVGLAPVPEDLDPADLAAMTSVTRALLNLHETITRY